MLLLCQLLSFKEWKNILYLQNLHLKATSIWETMIPNSKSKRYFMENRGKQAREDEDRMTLVSSSIWNLELPVSASAGYLWYGQLGKRNQRTETLACVISKTKLNYLSFLSSYNFSFSLNPGLLAIQVSIDQPVCAVQKHRERGFTL